MKLFDTMIEDSRDLVNSEYVIGCVVGVIKLAMSGGDIGDECNESVVAVDMKVWEVEWKRGVGGEWGGAGGNGERGRGVGGVVRFASGGREKGDKKGGGGGVGRGGEKGVGGATTET